MIEPGKILRVDYRKFCYNNNLDFFGAVKYGEKQKRLLERLRDYLWARRELLWDMQEEDGLCWIEFETLDDARMFMLSFSDIIVTNGVRFE